MADVLVERLQSLTAKRSQAEDAIDEINAAAQVDDRDLSDAERDIIARHRTRLTELEPQIVDAVGDIERRKAAVDARAMLVPRPTTSTGAVEQATRAGGVVASASAQGEPVYRDFATYARDLMISKYDQVASRAGGPGVRDAAQDRLRRAVANTLSSDVAGLIPPQHIAQIMQVINKNRPLVNASRRLNLTSGKITYPRITSRPTVSKQSTEKTETTSTKMSVIMVEKVASTFLGAGDLSWQAINWSTPDALALWFDLAGEAYAQATEKETGAIFGVGFDPAGSPVAVSAGTPEAWLTAIAAAAGVVYTNTGRTATGIATDTATFFEIAPLASQTRTIFMAEGSLNLQSQSGTVAGMQLFATPGLAADTVIVGDFTALLTAETAGAPVELRAVEPSIGGMEVGVIGAFLVELIEEAAFCKVTPPVVTP